MNGQLSRRRFLDDSLMLAAASTMFGFASHPRVGRAESATTSEPWYRHAYRRAVIDMHIPDWDENFFASFDPEKYADAIVASRAQSIVCYCQSHVGLFNYPTQVGQQHRAFAGRNLFQEMIDCCHRRGIFVQVYTSLIFDRWAGDRHPEWRMRTWDGKILAEGGRHAMLCPNSPYRDYVRSFVEEICNQFDFEGIRFDMTFWPTVCYCEFCQFRFSKEVGGEIPQSVDWLDRRWVAFQRARERWLVEFAALATGTVRRCKPQATVEHQASTFPQYWGVAVTAPLAKQNDFLQGDFYGDQLQGSFVRKLLDRLSPQRPFAYETSASVSLQDHTAIKSEALLEAKACSAIADSAAFVFIDAIDPSGDVNLRTHRRMGRIFDRWMPCYDHLGGQRVVDVGVYYSFVSKFDMAENGRHISRVSSADSHTTSSMQAAARLLSRQFLLGVLTEESLTDLADLRVLILSNVHMMDTAECETIRQWVRGGGKILATGTTSLVTKDGVQRSDFELADVFGVSLVKADWSARHHYLAPTAAGANLFPEFDATHPAFADQTGFEVRPHEGATVLATTTHPWPREDRSRFSSIHSDPPWQATTKPEIVAHRFGKGGAIYCGTPLENLATLDETFVRLVRRLESQYRLEATAPACVEITLFWQSDRRRYTVSVLNFQDELPNLPVEGIEIRLRLPQAVKAIWLLPDASPVTYQSHEDQIVFRVPRLETLHMFAIEVSP